MKEQQLHQSLQALRLEIDRLEDIDDSSRQRLERLTASIEQKLEQPQDVEHHLHLIELLRNEVAYFEGSHPALVMVLNEILTTLSTAGI